MHLAKNVTWRYISQLWLTLLELDNKEALEAAAGALEQDQQPPLADLAAATAAIDAADEPDDAFSVLFASESMEDFLAHKVSPVLLFNCRSSMYGCL